MTHVPASRAGRRRGGIAVQVALSLTAIFGIAAVTVDGALLLAERRHGQATADAAALAAAAQLCQSYLLNGGTEASSSGPAHTSALTVAAANGYSNDGTISSVTVNVSPANYQGGPNAGKPLPPGYAEVIVTYHEARLFSAIWGTSRIPVSARAVARGQWVTGNNGFLVLGPTGTTVTLSGSASISVPGGSFLVNSAGPNSVNASGGAKAVAASFGFHSSQANTGLSNPSAYLSGPGGSAPTISYSQPTMPDPLAWLPVPSTTGLTVQNPSGPTPWTNPTKTGTFTISPGIYNGGINVTGSANVTMNPGVYYLNGPLTWTGTGTLDATSGVLIYVAPGGSSPGISLTKGTFKINPMSSGIYQGVSLFQDRTSTAQLVLSGGTSWQIQGTIYAANALLNLSGPGGGSSSTDARGSQFIVSSVTVSGTSMINVGANGPKAAQQRVFQLVE